MASRMWFMRIGTSATKQQMKDMAKDVLILKKWLRDCIGQDWESATAPNVDSKLGISARST